MAQVNQGSGVPLAKDRIGNAAAFEFRSPSFSSGQALPPRFSAYHDDASPALSWSPVPDAKSYALIMEDPDAANVKPFVHWVAYNIPATEQSLPEGLPVDPRLLKPEGMLQGRTAEDRWAISAPNRLWAIHRTITTSSCWPWTPCLI